MITDLTIGCPLSDEPNISRLRIGSNVFNPKASQVSFPLHRFEPQAHQNLSLLVFGKEIEVQWNKRDRYGRIVGKVLVVEAPCKAGDCPKTVDACLSQITAGLAWWYRDNDRISKDFF